MLPATSRTRSPSTAFAPAGAGEHVGEAAGHVVLLEDEHVLALIGEHGRRRHPPMPEPMTIASQGPSGQVRLQGRPSFWRTFRLVGTVTLRAYHGGVGGAGYPSRVKDGGVGSTQHLSR